MDGVAIMGRTYPGCRISMMEHIIGLLGLRMEHTKPPTRLLVARSRSHVHQLISRLALGEFDELRINAVGMVTIPDVRVFQRRTVMYKSFLCAQGK